ncbi:MAG: Ig-like domain-containing protein [Bacteroidales bacterium]|nr:Ig-like domain-containing protein [Bacteroidales bacterium]
MNRWLYPILCTVVLLLSGCAKVVMPTGGPRDTEPAKMLKEDPPSGSVSFSESQIKITFDEFFTLNNPTENILISPPMATAPKYLINGKTLVIKLEDTLHPNTTYNMVFSDCIKDYHEGNTLSYYHYSFSTGPSIDSFSIRGKVLDAATLEGAKDFLVMLYHQDVDSLPFSTLPDYITKSLSNGSFTFDNIAAGNYKIFALKDINANMLYDLPNEQIAFADHPVSASVSVKTDSTASPAEEISIFSFEKTSEHPQLTRVENPSPGLYVIPYKSPVNHFSAQPLDNTTPYFESINPTKDTVFWFMKELVTDTLTFVLNADEHLDTILLTPYKAKPVGRGYKNEKSDVLSVSVKNQGHRFKPLTLVFPFPIRPADSIPIICITRKDTTLLRISVPDTFVKRLELPLTFDDKLNYTVIIPDSVLWDYNGKTNDSVKVNFETHSVKDYGNLTMEYICPETPQQYIAQLIKDKIVLQEDIFSENTTVSYPYLEPGNYLVKIIEDLNKNGRWDSGDYEQKRQPERVLFFSHPITIRAYWDSEEQFVVE